MATLFVLQERVMSDKEKPISEIGWASTGHCVRWLETNCKLEDFRPEDVFSFKVPTKGGVEALLRKKVRLHNILVSNMTRIEEFMEDRELEEQTVHAVAVLVINMDMAKKVVWDHILTCRIILSQTSQATFPSVIDENEIPF